MRCTGTSGKTPNGLHIKVDVFSSAHPCEVRTDSSAIHQVEITNRSLNTFVVNVRSVCETSSVRFRVDGQVQPSHVCDSIPVHPRPGTGGAFRRTISADLVSGGSSSDETIHTDAVWTTVGWPVDSSDTLYVQVRTV